MDKSIGVPEPKVTGKKPHSPISGTSEQPLSLVGERGMMSRLTSRCLEILLSLNPKPLNLEPKTLKL